MEKLLMNLMLLKDLLRIKLKDLKVLLNANKMVKKCKKGFKKVKGMCIPSRKPKKLSASRIDNIMENIFRDENLVVVRDALEQYRE